MKEPIQYLPTPERHWSWRPERSTDRANRQDCLTAARKGISLEELAERRREAKHLRQGRRIGYAIGAALFKASTGEAPKVAPVKGVRRTVEVTVSVRITEEDLF